MTKDEEIRQVTERLDGLLTLLHGNVDALNEILTRPPGSGEADERLVAP